jgi:hypothetical protein
MLGTVSGIALMVIFVVARVPRELSVTLFWFLHPAHVFLSALVTTAMYTRHGRHKLLGALAVGYAGAIGIATLSDCIIPYVGEVLLDLPNPGIHLGFLERPCAVNTLATAGMLVGLLWPTTQLPHAGHVLISTWASLFHILMALEGGLSAATYLPIALFLFLAVWLPCCTSDILFPLLFTARTQAATEGKP